jgi:hypothetical protein
MMVFFLLLLYYYNAIRMHILSDHFNTLPQERPEY